MQGYAQGQEEGKGCVVLAYGDSLTAGYGVLPAEAFPALLEKRLRAQGYVVTVVNAGVSGDTSADGLARLDWTLSGLERPPEVVILELGANDALRGEDPALMEADLETLIRRFKEQGAVILFTGMYAMVNMGDEYSAAYNAVFPRLAEKHQLAFYPFFLQGVAGVPELNQPDGIHPNGQGVTRIVDSILPLVQEVLDRAGCAAP